MRIYVVGCGAMGSIYAALFASDDHEVCVVDPNLAHIEQINSHGLRVYGASGDRTVRIRAFTDAPTLPPSKRPDLIICAVKARFIPSAADTLQHLCGPHTLIITLQTGLGSADIIAQTLGEQTLIVAIAAGFGASLEAPGVAHHNAMKAIRMGPYSSVNPERVQEMARHWQNAGFDAEAVDNLESMQWAKLICNVAYSGPCALSGLTVGEVTRHPILSLISRNAAREAYRIAQNLEIILPFNNVDQEILQFAQGMPDAKPSVLLDIERGSPSEINVINGAIAAQAQKIGLDAPVNQALTEQVLALQAKSAPKH